MLAAGSALGPYKILAPVGAGGMGEVYRAHDPRLGRDVAIKVLSPHLAATPEVRARFEREARTISQLNHPHICVLFDIGHQEGTDYLVMELLEGETLAHRLENGPLPVAETLSLGTQIADALDRAHCAGVVHRDLKPGNVMLTKAGAKLMDFGLARVGGLSPVTGSLADSPTVSRPLTVEGTILGTFQYMAPEQLEGKDADARSDLWALGCVLYEMATGRRAFEGESQATLIAAIMSVEPAALTQLAPMSPPGLDRLVRACLAKAPDDRIQTAHDARLQLRWVAEGSSQSGVPPAVAARRRGRERIAWGIAAAALLALGLQLSDRGEPARVVRFELHPPKGTINISWLRLSPDGQTLAFLASDSTGAQRLWLRPLAAVEAHRLEGIEGVRPFWSPDSKYLGFISEGKLRKIPVAGGPAVTICDAPGGVDGAWGKSGWLLFDGGPADSIRGVPATGGAVKAITVLDRAHGETQHGWPFFLPDGRHFLFVSSKRGAAVGTIRLGTLGSQESRVVGQTNGRAEYGPAGHLFYVSGSALVAQTFDAGAARVAGDPVPIGELLTAGPGAFSVSSAGVVAFQPRAAEAQGRLLWVDRNGHDVGVAAPSGYYQDVSLSPDGRRLAFSLATDQASRLDIWVRDLARGVNSRLTFDPKDEIAPVWSPDGDRIVFGRFREGLRCYIKAVNGVGGEDSLACAPGNLEGPFDWSGAANVILLSRIDTEMKWEIWEAPASGLQAPRPLIQSPFNVRWGRLSPDGRWLAYASSESGRDEVYVVPYPGPGSKLQISTAGGSYPQWRADGRELYFQGLDQSIMAVDVHANTDFEADLPKPLFKTTLTEGRYPGYRWAVSRDGQRFLVNTTSGAGDARVIVVLNWAAELGKP